ncbi:DNA polymerase III subunit delta [Solirhodobacter olei]|uniref:DNA polymerase III subunit delta n=1 Tax=Solirhodobacter olei TaxID=2493082 RepID=UPI000FD956C8|nr:DNA polymerase III subunit delta [Solirhodobacter olei]
MKLAAAELSRALQRAKAPPAGILLYGADAMRVALKRQDAVAVLLGANAESEMRLTRMSGADLRKDPALLLDAVKAQGFFPGTRGALVEDATDTLADTIGGALKDWREGDASILVTAGTLNARSALRKLFETNPQAWAIPLYDDPPGREEVEAMLAASGLKEVPRDAMTDLLALSRALDPGDFRQTVEKIALYKWGDDSPLTPAEIAALAPASVEAEVDDVLAAAAEAESGRIGPLMQRLEGQGVNPVTLCIGATRHFRALHAAASDPGGAAAGLARQRPPVFGPRRDRMARQAERWGRDRLEQALTMLIDTDLQLRSAQRAPQMALMERTLIRLAMLARR